ncbi:MAG: hypothetical protein WCY97_00355 [Methanothrix sp.]|jgi:hypothetical protein|uniref:Alpha-galactosidase NEW3 domain-containing protein n=1 Tax=Methanothrix harundinacea TaxID=301375 RepID=A0A124G3J8_9EURY|nr:MAG: hypothetical protein APR56_12975 [Methanosaeta sp. SDB]KUK44564.1 MAG: Uncharacterized protein XD72_1016 [Methanothrix harundinacea]MDD3709005.1 hypothetical protein [Methanothrix sp.]MDI9398456.1 hypothetical protein [Euryarchaeota archaeon]KUK97132.1 MAG: Uncharacterized protein XE07_0517 [Methanothrix harundinacea]
MRPDRISSSLCLLVAFLLSALFAANPAGAASVSGGVQFAGDHYKVEGGPKIDVSVVNPVFAPGTPGTLRLVLANKGVVDRLVPGTVPPGSEEEAAQEMLAEFGCLDASNLRADLRTGGQIDVLSGPVHLDLLGPGETAVIEFDLRIEDGAEGPVPLSLDLEYEHQVDVSFSSGTASPLYLPSSLQLDLILSVEGDPPALELMESRSDLVPGKKGSISIIVGNAGDRRAANCTARLLAASPFNPLTDRSRLGDIPPGGVAVARFDVLVEGTAPPQEYRIGCEISHDGGVASLSIPLNVVSAEGAQLKLVLLGILSGVSALVAFWLVRERMNRPPRRRSLSFRFWR